MTYSLVYDESGDYLIIPTDKQEEWEEVQWDYYDTGNLPEWAQYVDLNHLKITGYVN